MAGLLIYVNWQVFLIGILTGHVIEGSLGYFINPIVTVLLGVIVLKERLRTAQWVAIGFAGLAVIVIIVAYGSFPWIALTLAGVVTAVPLLLFASGARRAPLTVIGLLQFVAPILQFITGAWILQEPMPLERWIGFGLVWVALIVLSADSLIAGRRARGAADVVDLV